MYASCGPICRIRALIAWDDAPELTGAEQLWLAVEVAAAGVEERGPRRGSVLCVGTSARDQRG